MDDLKLGELDLLCSVLKRLSYIVRCLCGKVFKHMFPQNETLRNNVGDPLPPHLTENDRHMTDSAMGEN